MIIDFLIAIFLFFIITAFVFHYLLECIVIGLILLWLYACLVFGDTFTRWSLVVMGLFACLVLLRSIVLYADKGIQKFVKHRAASR
jgi:hypothetical protein